MDNVEIDSYLSQKLFKDSNFYLYDMESAFLVVAEMRKNGWIFDMDNLESPTEYSIAFEREDDEKYFCERFDITKISLPKAICMVAVDALKNSEDKQDHDSYLITLPKDYTINPLAFDTSWNDAMEEYMKDLQKQMEESIYDQLVFGKSTQIVASKDDKITWKRAGEKLEVKFADCSHNWKSYQGLTETYNYCTKCDKKDVDNQ